MQAQQFSVLIKLMRGSLESPACRAAFMVLVEGAGQSDCAREFGITRGAVSNAVKRYRDADALVRSVYRP